MIDYAILFGATIRSKLVSCSDLLKPSSNMKTYKKGQTYPYAYNYGQEYIQADWYEIRSRNCCRALMDTAALVWAGKSLVRFISSVELVFILFTLSPSHYNISIYINIQHKYNFHHKYHTHTHACRYHYDHFHHHQVNVLIGQNISNTLPALPSLQSESLPSVK